MIVGIADEDGAIRSDGDPVRAVESGAGGRAAVAVAAGLAGPGHGADAMGGRVDEPDGVVLGVDDPDIPRRIDGQLFGTVEGGRFRRPAVAPVPAIVAIVPDSGRTTRRVFPSRSRI